MTRLPTIHLPAVALAAALAVGAGIAAQPAHAQTGDGTYEFLKATEDRVWRLNRQTGEISVCTLENDSLVCTTSSEAARPPAASYEQLQEREAAAMQAQQEKEAAEREKALKLLDRMVEMIKEFANDATGTQ
ncbi:MAG: hypothetical protein JJ899_00800 [Alphaproteobacteria bacterium]|nr:hypothetical protein [Alphaproteobacteria bacterium]